MFVWRAKDSETQQVIQEPSGDSPREINIWLLRKYIEGR